MSPHVYDVWTGCGRRVGISGDSTRRERAARVLLTWAHAARRVRGRGRPSSVGRSGRPLLRAWKCPGRAAARARRGGSGGADDPWVVALRVPTRGSARSWLSYASRRVDRPGQRHFVAVSRAPTRGSARSWPFHVPGRVPGPLGRGGRSIGPGLSPRPARGKGSGDQAVAEVPGVEGWIGHVGSSAWLFYPRWRGSAAMG